MGDRPVRACSHVALLACTLLLVGACAPTRLADLPDASASAAWLASDEQARQRRQPILPTFVPEETRIEAVRYLLSISRMGTRSYPLDAIYARLDPSVRTGVTRLRAVGADGDVEFRELTHEFASALGACVVPIASFAEDLHFDGAPVVVVAPIKGERRIVEKALTHALGDVSLVQDLVRGSVAVDHPEDVRAVAERTLDVLRNRSVEIIEVEDHFGKAGTGGYRDFQINLRLPRSRVIGELQVHVKDLLLVKQRVGHGVYRACAVGVRRAGHGHQEPRNQLDVLAQFRCDEMELRPRVSKGVLPPALAHTVVYGGGRIVTC